jgi:CRISPR-associated protein Cas1
LPIFEKPPLETLTPAKERWTPIYLEHGRIEVDDSSVKWIGADRTIIRLPVATLSAIMLGPGTTITHAAIKACADSNTPICWVGQDGMRFYSFGISPNHDNSNARKHAELHGSTKKREEIARKMFLKRFPEADVSGKSIKELRGMEGKRIKYLYEDMGYKYGISWKGRDYNPNNWDLADNINKAISAANSCLYALCTAIVCSMGYVPTLGFVHIAGTLPFVYDIADMYKPFTTLEAAFEALSINPFAREDEVITLLKKKIENRELTRRIPLDIEELMQ